MSEHEDDALIAAVSRVFLNGGRQEEALVHRLLAPGAAYTGFAGVTSHAYPPPSHAHQPPWWPPPMSTAQMWGPAPMAGPPPSMPSPAAPPRSCSRWPPSGTVPTSGAAAAPLSQRSRSLRPDPRAGSVGAPPAASARAMAAELAASRQAPRERRGCRQESCADQHPPSPHATSTGDRHPPSPHASSTGSQHPPSPPVKPRVQAPRDADRRGVGTLSTAMPSEPEPPIEGGLEPSGRLDLTPWDRRPSAAAASVAGAAIALSVARGDSAHKGDESTPADEHRPREAVSSSSMESPSVDGRLCAGGACVDQRISVGDACVDRPLRAGDACVVRAGKMRGASGRVSSRSPTAMSA